MICKLLETIPNTSSGFRHVSVGGTKVWAITNSGYICNRCGITNDNPAGTGWNYGICVSITFFFYYNIILLCFYF